MTHLNRLEVVIMPIYLFRHEIKSQVEKGIEFRNSLVIPEVDADTQEKPSPTRGQKPFVQKNCWLFERRVNSWIASKLSKVCLS